MHNINFEKLGVVCHNSYPLWMILQILLRIKTTDAISIDNVNWCTPFNEFDEVLLDYRIYQYGLDMQFTATDIIDVSIKDDILKMSPDYHYEDFYNYISEIKEIMKTFSCE